jgi:poly(hydroxyalkanoate) depolymerase family esterase
MKHAAAIRRAMDAVRSSNPVEATRLIQEALGASGRITTDGPLAALLIPKSPNNVPGEPRSGDSKRRAGLAETIATLRALKSPLNANLVRPKITVPERPNFATRSFACAQGQRHFRLYVPSPKPCGLLVMLHGCQQTAEDFAVGTNMNAVAEAHNLLVAYPHQPSLANAMSCWNWFRPQDQERLGGEAEIIAGLTQAIRVEFGIPQEAIFVAGLSAGGAMAAILGATYPTLYSAVGIHSGLAYKSAYDVNSALAAMRGQNQPRPRTAARSEFRPRLIVFHGSGDRTVVPTNANLLWEDAVRSKGPGEVLELTAAAGGRAVDRRIFSSSAGVASVEEWIIHGSGHAWNGGNPQGSYTDAEGPHASVEMVRFFLAGLPAPLAGAKST